MSRKDFRSIAISIPADLATHADVATKTSMSRIWLEEDINTANSTAHKATSPNLVVVDLRLYSRMIGINRSATADRHVKSRVTNSTRSAVMCMTFSSIDFLLSSCLYIRINVLR